MRKLLLFLCVSLILSSCENNDDNGDTITAGTPLTFMEVGNYWKMEMTTFGASDTLTLTLTAVENNVFTVDITTSTDNFTEYWYVYEGFLKVYQDGEDMADAKSIFKSGGNIGDTWTNPRETSAGATTIFEIESITESGTTPSGTYDNLQKLEVTFSDAFNTQYNYWSPSVGQIKQTGFLTMILVETNVQ